MIDEPLQSRSFILSIKLYKYEYLYTFCLLTYVYPYVPTNTHLFVYIFLYINAFCALTCLLNAYTISKYTITCEINKKESKKAQKRGLKGKKRAMGAAHFNRLKLKKKKEKEKKW